MESSSKTPNINSKENQNLVSHVQIKVSDVILKCAPNQVLRQGKDVFWCNHMNLKVGKLMACM